MWKLRLIFVVGAFSLFGYAAYVIPKLPPNPPVPRSFQQIIRIDRPNPRGDREFLCETNNCNREDRFIGLQTHLLYQGMESIARGWANRTVQLYQVDSHGYARPTQ